MANSRVWQWTLMLALGATACGGQAKQPPGELGSGSAGSSSTGSGNVGSGNAGASSVGLGGQDGGEPSCSLLSNEPCAASEVCVDRAEDDCDGNGDTSCPGSCSEAYRTPVCSGAAGSTPCPAGLLCHDDPRTAEPGGLCAAPVPCPGECADGFECVDMVIGSGTCVSDRVNCWSPWLCPNAAVSCPYGYALSRVGVQDGMAECTGPCVPITHCGCATDTECPEGAACDRAAGDCVALLPWQPPPQCALPFDPGLCQANQRVFAAVDGICIEQHYGGCDGNDNRFRRLEECLAVCEGRPVPRSCSEGRVERRICVECGDNGGCKAFSACAKPCTDTTECGPLHCIEGVCQAGFCV